MGEGYGGESLLTPSFNMNQKIRSRVRRSLKRSKTNVYL